MNLDTVDCKKIGTFPAYFASECVQSNSSFQFLPVKQEIAEEDDDDLFTEDGVVKTELNYSTNSSSAYCENLQFVKLELEQPHIKLEKSDENVKVCNPFVEFNADGNTEDCTGNKDWVKSEPDEYELKIEATDTNLEEDLIYRDAYSKLGYQSVRLKSENEEESFSALDILGSDTDNDTNFPSSETGTNNNNSDKIKYSCSYCAYRTSSKGYLKTHTALHEDPNQLVWFYCTKCTYKTRQKGHLKRHDLIHLDEASSSLFICHICDYKFKQKCSLRRHIQAVHVKTTRPPTDNARVAINANTYECSSCPYVANRKDLLISHLDKHKSTDPFVCDLCSFSTKYRRNLRVHLETHVEDESLKVFECKMCRYKTRLRRCLKRHLASKRHLIVAGRLSDYRPRGVKVKVEMNFGDV